MASTLGKREGSLIVIISLLPYWPAEGDEVSDAAWPFVHHLNETYLKGRFFDRVWSKIKWVAPDGVGFATTNEMRAAYESGQDTPSIAHFAHAEHKKIKDDLDLARLLSDALSFVAPELYDARSRLYGETFEDEKDTWVALPHGNKTGEIEVTGFLYCLEQAHFILGARDLELRMLMAGHHLSLWKSDLQRLGATTGGKRSAATRQEGRKATPEEVAALADALLKQGHQKHNIASLIATRKGVTPDYVRVLLKKGRTEPGSKRD